MRGLKEIWNMCCLRSWRSPYCLVLCSYLDRCVQAVHVVGGRVRWRSGESNMGEGCRPWSICPGSNLASVLVTDLCASQHKLHVLHMDTGTVLRSIDLSHRNVHYPCCVRIHFDHIYPSHLDNNGRLQISKFSAACKVYPSGCMRRIR